MNLAYFADDPAYSLNAASDCLTDRPFYPTVPIDFVVVWSCKGIVWSFSLMIQTDFLMIGTNSQTERTDFGAV